MIPSALDVLAMIYRYINRIISGRVEGNGDYTHGKAKDTDPHVS
jgi:hypothetical protein